MKQTTVSMHEWEENVDAHYPCDTTIQSRVVSISEMTEPESIESKLVDSEYLIDLAEYFHLPLKEASEQLGANRSTLYRQIKKKNRRWPQRKIRSLNNQINVLLYNLTVTSSNTDAKEIIAELNRLFAEKLKYREPLYVRLRPFNGTMRRRPQPRISSAN
jgi:hypothetical protein